MRIKEGFSENAIVQLRLKRLRELPKEKTVVGDGEAEY